MQLVLLALSTIQDYISLSSIFLISSLFSLMAAKQHLFLLLLLTLLCSLHTHARESQMFNKLIPNTLAIQNVDNKISNDGNQNLAKTDKLSNFDPDGHQPKFFTSENDNSFGLYGHESGQSTPSPINYQLKKGSNFPYNAKNLPKNYNTVAYVTQVEDADVFDKGDTTTTSTPTTSTNNNNENNNHVNDVSNDFYAKPQGTVSSTSWSDRSYTTSPNNYMTGGRAQKLQPQGMSDTRFLDNGKYYYNVNAEKYSRYPYENAMEIASRWNQPYDTKEYRGGDLNTNSYQDNMEDQQYLDQQDTP